MFNHSFSVPIESYQKKRKKKEKEKKPKMEEVWLWPGAVLGDTLQARWLSLPGG